MALDKQFLVDGVHFVKVQDEHVFVGADGADTVREVAKDFGALGLTGGREKRIGVQVAREAFQRGDYDTRSIPGWEG